MKKFKYVLFTIMAIAVSTVATMAQAGAGGYNESYVGGNKALGAGIGFGLAAGLAGIGHRVDHLRRRHRQHRPRSLQGLHRPPDRERRREHQATGRQEGDTRGGCRMNATTAEQASAPGWAWPVWWAISTSM